MEKFPTTILILTVLLLSTIATVAGDHFISVGDQYADRRITISLSVPDLPPDPYRLYMEKRDQVQVACLMLAIFGEGSIETTSSRIGIAYAITNRMYHPKFPNSVCNVVLQHKQIESLDYNKALRRYASHTRDGVITIPPTIPERLLANIRQVAEDVYYQRIPDPTNGATHFYAPRLQLALGRTPPNWADVYNHVADIGSHKYYIMH